MIFRHSHCQPTKEGHWSASLLPDQVLGHMPGSVHWEVGTPHQTVRNAYDLSLPFAAQAALNPPERSPATDALSRLESPIVCAWESAQLHTQLLCPYHRCWPPPTSVWPRQYHSTRSQPLPPHTNPLVAWQPKAQLTPQPVPAMSSCAFVRLWSFTHCLDFLPML